MTEAVVKFTCRGQRLRNLSRVGEDFGHENLAESVRFILDSWTFDHGYVQPGTPQGTPRYLPGASAVPQTLDFNNSLQENQDQESPARNVENSTSEAPGSANLDETAHAAAPRHARSPKTLTEEQTRILPLVDKIQAVLRESCEAQGIAPPRDDRARAAITLEQALRLDINRAAVPGGRVTADQVLSAFRWAAQDEFYRGQVRSLSNVRKRWADGTTCFANLWSAWLRASGSRQTPAQVVRAGGDSAPADGYLLPPGAA